MAVQQLSRFCAECGRRTLHSRERFSFGSGCIVTLITGFIFLPFWCLISLSDSLKPFRCQTCGKKYSMFARRRKRPAEDSPRVVVQVVHVRESPPEPLPVDRPRLLPAQAGKPTESPAAPATPPAGPGAGRRLASAAGAALVRAVQGIPETTRAAYASVVATYRALPEWAAPMVWGLGIAMPIVTLMVAWRLVTSR